MALSTPDSDQRDFRDTSPGLRLVLLCFFSISLMVLDNQNQHIQDVRRILSAATYPIRLLVDAPFSLGHWIGDSLSTRTTLRTENRELHERILTQDAHLQRLAALEAGKHTFAGVAGVNRQGRRSRIDRGNHVGGHESVPPSDRRE